jgi:hypothetical protein
MKKEEYFLTHFDVAFKRESLGRKTVLIIVLDQTLCLKYSIDQVRHSCATNHNSYLNYTLNKLIKIILIYILVLYFNSIGLVYFI